MPLLETFNVTALDPESALTSLWTSKPLRFEVSEEHLSNISGYHHRVHLHALSDSPETVESALPVGFSTVYQNHSGPVDPGRFKSGTGREMSAIRNILIANNAAFFPGKSTSVRSTSRWNTGIPRDQTRIRTK
jgi:hypothetical protein